jgi:ribonuclease HI
MEAMTITAAADGSALGNPGPAGWAWYIDEERWHAGGWPHGTNNQGELMAVLDLFRSTAHVPEEPLHVLCDSQYVINCVTKWIPGWKRRGWKKADGKPVLNVDLLRQIDAELVGRTYEFEWVRGHAGHDLNEAADQRARAVAQAYQSGSEPPEGPGFGTGRGAAQPTEPPRSVPGAEPGGLTPEPSPEQPELFASIDDEPAGSADSRDVTAVVELEQELLTPEVRGDYGQLAYLLHPEYREIGASGRLWGREDLIEDLVDAPELQVRFELIEAMPVSRDAIQVLYRAVGASGATLRSSLWQRTEDRWRLRFHQGTPES